MFDYGGDGGLGFQISMNRLLDDFDEAGRIGRENALQNEIYRMRLIYNQLLAQAQSIERTLRERDQQVSALQNDLAVSNQQLEVTKQELKGFHDRYPFDGWP